ncbi:uncharacterized protein LOC114722987 [Neltuma alba]|uniref:uncharacterized protein LOC114722987 n=1 Tax=Neltuma alba TaxID=207710 RepID=UPI0010A4784A|nr:uncharacterized protein LOC114722987 [Prosopis alba]
MYAGVFGSHLVLRYPTLALFSKQWYLGKSSLELKEFAEGISLLVPLNGLSKFSFANIRCDADKRGKNQRRKHVSRRTKKGDENQRPRTFDGNRSKSPDQEEIIALLRRIQLSISKGESQGSPTSSPHKDKPSVESILDVLRESGKQVKDKVSEETTENETLTRGVSGTEEEVSEHPQESNFKFTRLSSKFVRKSPIPLIPVPRRKALELNDEASAVSGAGDKQGQSEGTLERMKLSELKEIAKSKKIKGYSKLKKRELIEVLGS